jgi:HAD superfamily hydrolase (TIGR01509 family)
VFNSFHIGLSKRDPETFTHITDRIGVPSVETLFVDDSPDHVERARSRGLHTVVCTDETTLTADPAALGLP